jgi:hypothetical protein
MLSLKPTFKEETKDASEHYKQQKPMTKQDYLTTLMTLEL